MKIPEGYLSVMPYLILEDANGFMDFMKASFGATVKYTEHRSKNIIKHAELQIGPSVIMFAEATEEFKAFPANIFIYVENAEDIFKRAISNGATQLQEIATREYGHGGGFADRFGNHWWINTPLSKE